MSLFYSCLVNTEIGHTFYNHNSYVKRDSGQKSADNVSMHVNTFYKTATL